MQEERSPALVRVSAKALSGPAQRFSNSARGLSGYVLVRSQSTMDQRYVQRIEGQWSKHHAHNVRMAPMRLHQTVICVPIHALNDVCDFVD